MIGKNVINGEWVDGQGETLQSINPSTSTICWEGCQASALQVSEAVQSAIVAQRKWGALPLLERIEIIERFVTGLNECKEVMATIISSEMGKPNWEAKTEVQAAINKLAISIKAYKARTGENSSEASGIKTVLKHKPHGVLAVLGPYNFPLHLPNGHIIPALLAGNTIVFKPSELTPWVAEKMMEVWLNAGLPNGVLNLVQGNGQVGKQLLSQPVNGVLFTGSAETGIKIHQQFSGRPEVLLALEMGGNNPLIVSEIDDIDAAVYHTIQSAFITSGQRCTCARRLIIDTDTVPDEFTTQLIQRTKRLHVGIPSPTKESFMGPLVSQKAMQTVLEAQTKWQQLGGESLLICESLADSDALLSPGIIDMSTTGSIDEEIFGPLLQLYRVKGIEAAVTLANNTRYGLSAGLLSSNAQHYDYFYQHINAGIVNFNRPLTGAASSSPFGGVGLSGNHRPSAYYAADYCAYPVGGLESSELIVPESTSVGMNW